MTQAGTLGAHCAAPGERDIIIITAFHQRSPARPQGPWMRASASHRHIIVICHTNRHTAGWVLLGHRRLDNPVELIDLEGNV
jgi:hypothetical protein